MVPTGIYERHVFSNEEIVYMLRRAADELVSLVWLLSKYEAENKYPCGIEIDCIGAVVKQTDSKRHRAFVGHIEVMEALNHIANAFKHSFINSDHTLIVADEPRIHALGLANNKLRSKAKFYDVSISDLIIKYNAFYKSCVSWLSGYSMRNR